jgi:chemotaxis protein CheD
MSAGSMAGHFAAQARQLVVRIADAKVSRDPEAVLVTYALGSCIAICMFDPVAKVGGLLHIMLPDSGLDAKKAEANPYMFADTGIGSLLRMMAASGALQKRITVRLAGGAQVVDARDLFSIGKRNYTAVRKILWKEGLLVDGEIVGGEVSRTVRLEVGSGRFMVRESGCDEREIPLKGPRYGR